MKKSICIYLLLLSSFSPIYSEELAPIIIEWKSTYFDQIKENVKKSGADKCIGWENFRNWIYAQVMIQFFSSEIKAEDLEKLKTDAGNLASVIDLKGIIHFLHNTSLDTLKKFACELPEKAEVNPTITYVYIYSNIYAPTPEPGKRNDKMNPSGIIYSLQQAFGK
jgi:hypothetical protein